VISLPVKIAQNLLRIRYRNIVKSKLPCYLYGPPQCSSTVIRHRAGTHRLSTGNIVNPPKQPIFISDISCRSSDISEAGHKPAAAADALSTPYINCFDSSWPRVKIHRPFHCFFLAIASLYSHAIQNNSAVCVSAWTGIAQRQ